MNASAAVDPAYAEQLQAARKRLADKGLLNAGDSLSLRIPGIDSYLFMVEPAAGAYAAASLRPLGIIGTDAAETHRLVYAARGDVGAILLNRQHWAAALPTVGGVLPGIFDEQLRHLGWKVTQITLSTLFRARRQLMRGGNAFGLGSQVLIFGMTAERLIYNAELLEKCAKAYLLAKVSGRRVRRIPWLVRYIATRRLNRELKRAAASFARGELPVRSAGYA
jgi:hypothetical protein